MHCRPPLRWVLAIGLFGCSAIESRSTEEAFTFFEVAESTGLVHRQAASLIVANCGLMQGETCVPEMTGGAAAADLNGDGWVDLIFTRWDAEPLVYRNRGGRFEDVSAQTGIGGVQRTNGVAIADIDNDGDLDILMTTLGADSYHLWINDGNDSKEFPHFTNQTASRGLALEGETSPWGMSASIGDVDGDGWMDVHVCEWRARDDSTTENRTRLLRNRGGERPGFFVDETELRLARFGRPRLSTGWENWAFTSVFQDWDGDGRSDLFIAGDYRTSQLFWNQGNTFSDGTEVASVNRESNAMGIATGDVDGDGLPDLFVTSIYDPDALGVVGNRLYRNTGNRTFEDITIAAGVRDGGWAWGTQMFDPDNDGDLDIVLTAGMNFASSDRHRLSPLRLWINDGVGSFTEASASHGLNDRFNGRGIVVLDYDNDGRQDVLVIVTQDRPRLYRNRDPENPELRGRSILVRTRGIGGGAVGIGARIVATFLDQKVVRYVQANSGFLSQSDSSVSIGLGAHKVLRELTVTWPDGRQDRRGNLHAYDRLDLEPSAIAPP